METNNNPMDGVEKEFLELAEEFERYFEDFENSETKPVEGQIEKLRFCERILKKIVRGDNISVYTDLDPSDPTGAVYVTGNNVRVDNTEWVCRAAEFADNMGIEALSSDAVRFEFTFYNVYKKK